MEVKNAIKWKKNRVKIKACHASRKMILPITENEEMRRKIEGYNNSVGCSKLCHFGLILKGLYLHGV